MKPVIVFYRMGGFAGVSERWTVYPDGRVVAADGVEKRAAPEQVAALLAEIDRLGFFGLASNYGLGSPCRDCFSCEISVVGPGGSPKTVVAVQGAGDTPPEFLQVVEAIERLLAGLQNR